MTPLKCKVVDYAGRTTEYSPETKPEGLEKTLKGLTVFQKLLQTVSLSILGLSVTFDVLLLLVSSFMWISSFECQENCR